LWLIAGLGNPGTRYEYTRHNAGFLAVDELLRTKKLTFKEKEHYRIAEGSRGDEKIILLEPLTFMNNSGVAVRKVMQKSNLSPEDLIVIHDDLDLATGSLKIRKKGSSGGHKGIESIIQNIGSGEFVRIKIGIGRDPLIPAEKYVLSKFRKDEMELIRDALGRAVESVDSIIDFGIEKTMNRFNRHNSAGLRIQVPPAL
jgi:peptidyl-tRNA hydrolase, PTH1 family